MRNVAPTRALERRSRDLLKLAVLILLVGGLLFVVGLSLFVVSLVVPSNPGFQLYDTVRTLLLIGGVIFGVIGLLLGLRAFTWKTDNTVADMTGKELAQYLDDRYIFIRNISKRAIGYIDAILVGPPGILVFRITDKEGIFFNDAGNWLRQKDKGEWIPLRWNPTREVVDDIKRLRDYLADQNLGNVPVYGVIVFTKPTPAAIQITLQAPIVPVVYLPELSYNLSDSYFAKDRTDKALSDKVVKLLYTP